MTTWFRAHNLENLTHVFSGEGGLFVAGRWNYKGRRAVYCSQSISLCTLEWLSHNGLSVSGFNYFRFSIEIPSELIQPVEIAELPGEWIATPATDVSREIAEKNLFNSDQFLGLTVPSVVIPEEKNLIINPLHRAYGKVLKTAKCLGQYNAPRRD